MRKITSLIRKISLAISAKTTYVRMRNTACSMECTHKIARVSQAVDCIKVKASELDASSYDRCAAEQKW